MGQQSSAGGDALQEAALSFTGVVTIITFCCCSTMSCVALCIKFVSWIVGHRGRRRRILFLPQQRRRDHGQTDDNDDDQLCPYPNGTVIALDSHPSEQRHRQVLRHSEIDLREVPVDDMEQQQQHRRGKGDDDREGELGCNIRDEKERLKGGGILWIQRETTDGSTVTLTGTPSINGEQELTPSCSSHEGEGRDVKKK